MKRVPPEVRTGRKLLLAVADLHVRGYQRLRVLPCVGSAGVWRCVIAPACLVSVSGSCPPDPADEDELQVRVPSFDRSKVRQGVFSESWSQTPGSLHRLPGGIQ